MENIFAVYKPSGITSHDAVMVVKRALRAEKVGHAGTLDPLARGVLVIGVGREATRQLGTVVKHEKEYLARVRFGETSATDDEEGEKTVQEVKKIPLLPDIERIIKKFVGEISQRPPLYSALKIKGKAAYRYARKGEALVLPPRKVSIQEIEILKFEWPFLDLRVVTGPGVYIRSLARDIGENLGVGGYLADLERTRVGEFTKERATRLEDVSMV